MLGAGLGAEINLSAWVMPDVFKWLSAEGGISQEEMLKTFNSGIGFVAAVSEADVDAALSCFADAGQEAFPIGRVVEGQGVRYSGTFV
jgi:phosphoribosylformylglycinamidine cyclo-ligase